MSAPADVPTYNTVWRELQARGLVEYHGPADFIAELVRIGVEVWTIDLSAGSTLCDDGAYRVPAKALLVDAGYTGRIGARYIPRWVNLIADVFPIMTDADRLLPRVFRRASYDSTFRDAIEAAYALGDHVIASRIAVLSLVEATFARAA